MLAINNQLLWMLIGTFAALSVGTVVRIVALRDAAADLVQKRMGSLKVWWTLALLMSLAVIFGVYGAALFLGVASWMGLTEFLRLVGMTRIGRPTIIAAFASVPVQYGLLAGGFHSVAIILLPIGLLLLVCALRSLGGSTSGYIRTTAAVFWGVMLIVYCLSHAVLLFKLPVEIEPVVGVAGWFVFLVVLTEMNDIMQALVGRRIGRTKITPNVSPNKTLAGLTGGMITTIILSLLLSPWLTTFGNASAVNGIALSVGAGLLISFCGFLGDINMSAIKRDAGVKDGSKILPGMGGIIDRIDSLTFTAPVFYYFVYFLA
jgi:phosphatidate cytidylyltransferase